MFFPTLLVLLAILTRTSTAPTEGTCPGGYKEGEKVEKGTSWFECRNGQLVVKGCLTTSGDRLKLNDIYDAGNVRSECEPGQNGDAILVSKSCFQDNRAHQPEERWDDSKYVYTCKKEGGTVKMRATGCIRNNQKVDAGVKMVIGDVVYECKTDQGAEFPVITAWGCAAADGTQHAGGEKFDVGQYWYTCENKNGIVTSELSGCVNEKLRVANGDRLSKGNVVFECQAAQGDGNLKVVGCLQEDVRSGMKIERRVGCTWTEGDAPYQVTMTCTPDQEAKTAVATAVHCDYKMPGSTTYSIGIGCYRLFENVAVGCVKDSNTGKISALKLQMNEKGNDVQSPPEGLKFC